MTYTEWTALPVERRNAMCAEAMGLSQLPRGGWFRDGLLVTSWSPCTDRNHTAMMAEAVSANANLVTLFNKHLSDVTDHWPLGPLFVLGIEPDMLAWAACVALEKEM